jgi:hypothetical protein
MEIPKEMAKIAEDIRREYTDAREDGGISEPEAEAPHNRLISHPSLGPGTSGPSRESPRRETDTEQINTLHKRIDLLENKLQQLGQVMKGLWNACVNQVGIKL